VLGRPVSNGVNGSPPRPISPFPTLLAVLAFPLCTPVLSPAAAQAPEPRGRWDEPRVRRLVVRAREARAHAFADTSLRGFEARAEGHVYYLARIGADAAQPQLDPDASGHRLVRADQVALRILWQAPDRAVQTIVGRRSRKRLPTRIHYHIDHLALILNNFGDSISLGEETEVRAVPHPAGDRALETYRYRLADSLRMRIGDRRFRLYRIEFRPRDPDSSGAVGELFLERETAAIARLRFTFTPAAYRDANLEGIEVDLENALWEGRFWLPARQRLEIRRGMRVLDFPLAGVIRTEFEMHDVRINPPELPSLPVGTRIASHPADRVRAYDRWREGLYAGPIGTADRDEASTGQIRELAREIARERILAGGRRTAPELAGLSSLFRVRRAEGARFGVGGRHRLDARRRIRAWIGHPAAEGGVEWRASYEGPLPLGRLTAEAYGDRHTDIGPFDAASGLTGTFGFLLRGEDFVDPYRRDGVRVTGRWERGPGTLRLGLAFEDHERARLVAFPPGNDPVRPIPSARPGELAALRGGYAIVRPRPGGSWSLDLSAEAATGGVGDFGFTRTVLELRGSESAADRALGWELRAGAAALTGSPPPQRILLLGGRGTVPGYPFRAWVGDLAAFARVAAVRELFGPWLRVRAVGAAGWTDLTGPAEEAGRTLGAGGSGGIRPSLGGGVDLLDGLLRLETVRGLDDGRWEWMVSFDRKFWPAL